MMSESTVILLLFLGASFLFTLGFAGIAIAENLLKKIFALAFMQSGAVLFFIVLAYRPEGTVPIFDYGKDVDYVFVNPLPHVLMLTAIVVGIALLALALALLINVYKGYGSLLESDVLEAIERREEAQLASLEVDS